jgi:ElaB/YqjD/DUF883 family membrane-anchored ribosome-binding protein
MTNNFLKNIGQILAQIHLTVEEKEEILESIPYLSKKKLEELEKKLKFLQGLEKEYHRIQLKYDLELKKLEKTVK